MLFKKASFFDNLYVFTNTGERQSDNFVHFSLNIYVICIPGKTQKISKKRSF